MILHWRGQPDWDWLKNAHMRRADQIVVYHAVELQIKMNSRTFIMTLVNQAKVTREINGPALIFIYRSFDNPLLISDVAKFAITQNFNEFFEMLRISTAKIYVVIPRNKITISH